jgi:hypothetical protein
MKKKQYPALKQKQEKCVEIAVKGILRYIQLAHSTCYRTVVTDTIESHLRDVDRECGLPRNPIPRRRRALILTPKVQVPQTRELTEYVKGVALSMPVSELEELVIRTESLDLVRRFRRWMPGADRKKLNEAVALLEVHTA